MTSRLSKFGLILLTLIGAAASGTILSAALNVYARQRFSFEPFPQQAQSTPATSQVTPPGSPASPQSAVSTPNKSPNHALNWAGYVAENGTFTQVTATWIIPNISGSLQYPLAADAAWVGIGGVKGTDLIQAGTQEITTAGSGTSYQAWFEMLPDSTQNVSLDINPGDSMTVSISEASTNLWNISITNNTTGKAFHTTVQYASSLSSAEWIEEMPTINGFFAPFDSFSTIQFKEATAVKDGNLDNIYQLGGQATEMIDFSGQILAYPSSIGADGKSFFVTRTDTASTPAPAFQIGFQVRG